MIASGHGGNQHRKRELLPKKRYRAIDVIQIDVRQGPMRQMNIIEIELLSIRHGVVANNIQMLKFALIDRVAHDPFRSRVLCARINSPGLV